MAHPFHGDNGEDGNDSRSVNFAPVTHRFFHSSRHRRRSPIPLPNRSHPLAHPDSSYNRLKAPRYRPDYYYYDDDDDDEGRPDRSYAPVQPVHAYRGRDIGHWQSVCSTSTVIPGADNLGAAAAGGGTSGIAVGVANSNGSVSGFDAMSGYQYEPPEGMYQGHSTLDNSHANFPNNGHNAYNVSREAPMDGSGYHYSNSGFPENVGSAPTGYPQQSSYQGGGGPGLYNDPYQRQHGPVDPSHINPNDILDDGDDGFLPNPQRRSLLSLGRNSSRNSLPSAAAGAAVAGGGAGALAGSALAGSTMGLTPDGNGGGSPGSGLAKEVIPASSSEWLDKQKSGWKKMKWIICITAVVLIIGGIVGGVLGGVLPNRIRSGPDSSSSDGNSDGDGPGEEVQNADDDARVNGELDKDSDEIKALMNNPDLHKVFPAIDYTPWGTQYPLCLTYPPSQNNVTRDMAVLSQLTNTVRLYGTDCNQTQMVLHAIDKLELKDMKVWMGVWLDTNTTTNNRQLKQMYDILDEVDDISVFKGVIVGNEVLYRGFQSQETLNTLSNYIKSVKSNFSEKGIDLPVATSDLGDAWTEDLAEISDAVMANVHPFFGGVPVDQAAGWTWTFWTQHNKVLTEGTEKPNIIAEVGWPTGGGNNCAPQPKCPDDESGAVAGIEELNKFMDDWVCQAMKNGTDYFWFEAFDEPWKVQYNEPGKEWEDKWGLMTPDRKLKKGLKIPDCGGKTAE